MHANYLQGLTFFEHTLSKYFMTIKMNIKNLRPILEINN